MAVSTNMSSAFNLVDKELKMFGFTDSAVKLVRDYLNNRKSVIAVM